MVRGIIHPETGVNRMVSESSLPVAGKSATRRSDSATSAFAGASWNCARVTGYSSLIRIGEELPTIHQESPRPTCRFGRSEG